jgi:hypothetical protein
MLVNRKRKTDAEEARQRDVLNRQRSRRALRSRRNTIRRAERWELRKALEEEDGLHEVWPWDEEVATTFRRPPKPPCQPSIFGQLKSFLVRGEGKFPLPPRLPHIVQPSLKIPKLRLPEAILDPDLLTAHCENAALNSGLLTRKERQRLHQLQYEASVISDDEEGSSPNEELPRVRHP